MDMNNSLRFSVRAANLQPFRTLGLLARAKELVAAGRDVIRLDVGEPDFGTPQPVLEAAREALAKGTGRYTEAAGKPGLRAAIAQFYKQKYRVCVDPRRVIVTTGSSAGLMLVMSAFMNQGEGLLAATPGYPSHPVFASVVNGNIANVKASVHGALWASPAEFEAAWTDATRGILVGSPSNPTGSLIPWQDAQALIDLTQRKGGIYISEELYHGLSYNSQDHSALEYSDDVFVINSFSKYFSMTGWRLGWIIVPERVVDRIEMLAQHLYLSPPDISQAAGLACFSPDVMQICESRRLELKERRDTLLYHLQACGFEISYPPDAGLFIFADARKFTNDSYAFAKDLLEQVGVSVAPGIDFGDYPTHLRFGFCTSGERLVSAVERIRAFIQMRATQASAQT
jgi:aspartate/methionine/tyrosine aminotransferase